MEEALRKKGVEVGGLKTLHDEIAGRKQAEEALLEMERRLRLHMDNSPLAVVEWDRDFIVTLWAGEAKNMFGWTAGETVGKPIMDLHMIYDEDIPIVLRTMEQLTDGTSRHVVSSNRNYTKDRRVIHCTWYNSILQDAHGKMSSVLSFVLDNTSLVETQEALRKAHDDLEIRVRERTIELQKANEALKAEIAEKKRIDEEKRQIEAQMLRAQRMESIGTLAAGIAHDFNNILTPIILNTTAALMDLPNKSPVRKYQERTLVSANRARDLVQQILTFSRKGEYDLKSMKFQDVLMEALKLLRASIPSTIDIRQKIDLCGPVLADPTQIHQVVMNLCTNAYQAMRESGGILEISLNEVDIDDESGKRNLNLRPGRYVRFTVRDTGHGMDKTTMERIFDPFFTTKGTGGNGLGLAVVQGIAIGHGGDIDVQSQPGKGATFHVYLPRAAADGIEQVESKKEESIPTGKERILFVDDEPDIAFMGKEMLERLGYDVTAKTDSLEAVEEFRANSGKYDLVVTDYSMPKMNGLELARGLVKIRPGARIILTSGFNETITPEKLRMYDISSTIMKPYAITELAKAIRQVFDKKGD